MLTKRQKLSLALVSAVVGLAAASCRDPATPSSSPPSTSAAAPPTVPSNTAAPPTVPSNTAAPSAAPDPANAATPDTPELLELQSTCHDKQDAVACLRAATIIDRGGSSAEALPWWQAACDYGGASSCIEVARRGQPTKPLSSSPGYRRACELGLREGCVALGFMAETDGLQDQSEGWFAKACLLGDTLACGRIGGKNAAKVEATLREKCTAKDGNACVALGGLPGDGADARLRWLERTCAKGNGFACYARALAAPRAKVDERVEWMKKACALDVKHACAAVAPSK